MEELKGNLTVEEVSIDGSTYIAEELVGVFSVAVVNIEGGTPSIEFLEEKVAETLQYRDEAKYASENVNVFIPHISEDGTLTFTNGAGLENPAPVKIRGEKGEDGRTPIKGVDYYTESDKQEIIDNVLANFPAYEGAYNISPSRQTQVLETTNKVLSDDITIAEISYAEVSNNSGGTTYYIAKEQ